MSNVKGGPLFAAIVGGGCAGLTAAVRLERMALKGLAIFEPNNARHDHIWAFWDDGGADLEPARQLTEGKWKKWDFIGDTGAIRLEGKSFVYRAISSAAFENSLRESLKNAEYIKERVVSADQLTDCFKVSLESGRNVYAKNLFDSRSPSIRNGEFLQHFLGWRVHSETPIFDEETATLMDFRVPQDEGIHFIYLLPFNSKQALVESTVLSSHPLPDSWYEKQISAYLSSNYPGAVTNVTYKEKGIIPLVQYRQLTSLGVPIGVRAGALRASSGYAFSQIQRQIFQMFNQQHIEAVDLGAISGAKPGCDRFESWMDRVFLRVLRRNPEIAPELFLKMAAAVDGDTFARFMRGYGDWRGRLSLMRNLPTGLFLGSVFRSSTS